MFALVLQMTASVGFLIVPALGSDNKYVSQSTLYLWLKYHSYIDSTVIS